VTSDRRRSADPENEAITTALPLSTRWAPAGESAEPASPKDEEILDTFERMGGLTGSLISEPKQSFANRNAALAQDLACQDPEINRLMRAGSFRGADRAVTVAAGVRPARDAGA
jgi:hypothetical protein